MNITKASTELIQGHAILNLEIDGHSAYIDEPKQTLLDAGIVVLLDDDGYWETAVSAVYIDGQTQTTLPGATTDPAVVALVRRFVAGAEGNLLEA
jgi:hypothetical protein